MTHNANSLRAGNRDVRYGVSDRVVWLEVPGNPMYESGYSAHVPELRTILVTGKSVGELTQRATEAIQLWGRVLALKYLQPRCAPKLKSSCPSRGPEERGGGLQTRVETRLVSTRQPKVPAPREH